MKCPQCGEEMYDGYIPSEFLDVPFVFANKENLSQNIKDELKFNIFVEYKPYLSLKRGFFPKAKAYFCEYCRQVIVPVEKK